MSKILHDLDGVICHRDNVLILGSNERKHDQRVYEVLNHLTSAGVTLNDKCEYSVRSIKFLGHLISAKGVDADSDEIIAIKNLPPSTDIGGVRRFLGLANQLSKFISGFSDKTAPLQMLFAKNSVPWY